MLCAVKQQGEYELNSPIIQRYIGKLEREGKANYRHKKKNLRLKHIIKMRKKLK